MTSKQEFYAGARRDGVGPLGGVRVLDVTTAWSGPMATCLLADLGADVVRVDAPGRPSPVIAPSLPGTHLSWAYETVNRNKRSVTLDVRDPADRRTFLRLVATADVVVENFRPGVLAGYGVGYEGCRQVKDDIVFVSISGWGQYGPACDRPGYDPAALASAGWMALNGDRDGGPTRAPTYLADDLAALHAALGALAALRHRDRTGEGQHVDVSLLDSVLFQSDGLLSLAAMGAQPERHGNEQPTLVPCNVYACRDGHVSVTVPLDRHWARLATAMGVEPGEGLATNRERVRERVTVDELVGAWCADRPVDEVVESCRAAGVVAERVRSFAEAAADPHVIEREMLVERTLSDGSTAPLTGPAAKFSRTPTSIRRTAPRPGADTEAVLAELDRLDGGAPAGPAG